MKLTTYDEYKESGIIGIESIPEHWEVKRIKDIFTLKRGKFTHRPRNDSRLYVGGTLPFIQTGDISQANKYIIAYKQKLNENGIKVSKKFKKDTIVMTIAANIGDVAILGFDTYFPDSIVGFLTKENHHYFYYLLTATKSELDKVKVTNTQDNLNLERLNGLLKIYPPQEEQVTIANYLDEKTTQVDKKIQLFEQKIRAYSELKQSLINESVCRGLDKDVPLKNSGVPWIDEIPMHWEVKRLKDVSNLKFSNVDKKTYEGQDEVLLCNYIDVYKNDFISCEMDFMQSTASKAEIQKFQLTPGDVLITKDSESSDDIAKPAFVKSVCKNLLCGYHLALIRANRKVLLGEYLFRLFQSVDFNYNFSVHANGITRVGLSIGTINNVTILFPPISEQAEIAKYLDEKTHTIDAIVANLTRQIETLQELKKILINDVVTGKLRVT